MILGLTFAIGRFGGEVYSTGEIFGALCTEYDSLQKGMHLVTTAFMSCYRASDKPFNNNGVSITLQERAPFPN